MMANRNTIRAYHVEVLPPKQDSETLSADLEAFGKKVRAVLARGDRVCITDNAMGLLAFQGTDVLEHLNLPVDPEEIMIHLNTFHTRADLHRILETCRVMGIRDLLVISGDGSDRLPRLAPEDLGITGVEVVTSVELLDYIRRSWPDTFRLGVAFNPYEPPDHEFAKLDRKLRAGATFAVTQPLIGRHPVVDRLLENYPDLPVTVEAWMSTKLRLLSDAVGYVISEDTAFDPLATLDRLREIYPDCGVYLSLLRFKTQYPLLPRPQWDGPGGQTPGDMVVCVKQVPATGEVSIDPQTKRIVREGVQAVMNPFDLYALEEALRLRSRRGGRVIALSMGPPNAQRVLREALALGADRAVLLSDRAFGGSDTWATSYVLARAIRTLGGVDLVICGKQAIDGDTAQVGPGLAAHLGWLQAAGVQKVDEAGAGKLVVRRLHEDGYDRCLLEGPAVLTVTRGINSPRVPTLRSHLKALEMEIPRWSPRDIGADPEKIGLDGSPTRVVKSTPPAPRHGQTLRISGPPRESARQLVAALRRRGVL